VLHADLPHAGREPLRARMDPDHLHRVVVNLLDNALRHGSGAAGSVLVVLKKTSATTCRLSVYSDGPPIPSEVERSLFEPFFSTRSQGTGLGLYISRQLCERAGARLDYRPRPLGHRHRNEFFISFHLEPAAATS
jgi:two-component system sensor histidine kinase PilS (NtrC family)